MQNNFACPLSISGTEEQLQAIEKKLQAIGYKSHVDDIIYSSYPVLATNYMAEPGLMDSTLSKLDQDYNRTPVSAEDEDLILALASMREGNTPYIGEIWHMTNAGGWGFYSANNRCLARVEEVDNDYNLDSTTRVTCISGTLLNPKKTGDEKLRVPLFDRSGQPICRKATKEEIIDYFKGKTEPEFVLPEKWAIKPRSDKELELIYKATVGDLSEGKSTQYYYHYPGFKSCCWASNNVKEGYTEITFEQFEKHVLKMDKKKVIGYICPKDLYAGEVPKGSIFRATSSHPTGNPMFVATNKEAKIINPRYELPLAIVEDWEPVYEEEFKEGDWIIIEDLNYHGSTWLKSGDIVQLGGKFWNEYPPSSGHISCRTKDYPDGNSGHFPDAKYRKLTDEEVRRYKEVKIMGYSAEKEDGRLVFGCQSFSQENIDFLKRLIKKPISAKIAIGDVEINEELIGKLNFILKQ